MAAEALCTPFCRPSSPAPIIAIPDPGPGDRCRPSFPSLPATVAPPGHRYTTIPPPPTPTAAATVPFPALSEAARQSVVLRSPPRRVHLFSHLTALFAQSPPRQSTPVLLPGLRAAPLPSLRDISVPLLQQL
uniref:Uncharacterized protein n=1 Tax=Setaria viridis TaxID=4556 RepID=A0A4U6TJG3_SETVI|nr:hypothetical protein SEVIR_8G152600v2 [Setaria viridis]